MQHRIWIFDLDGTLLDTLDSLYFTANETLRKFGCPPITREECRSFVGNGIRVLQEKALAAHCGKTGSRAVDFDEFSAKFSDLFRSTCTYHVRPYKGIEEALSRLKEEGYLLAVLSNKPQEMAEKVIRESFGDELFFAVVGQSDTRPRKPDPAGVRYVLAQAAEYLGCEAADFAAVYIGDSEVDAETARNANLPLILCTWGFRERSQLEPLVREQDVLIDSPAQLIISMRVMCKMR